MATTKIIRLHVNKGKNTSSSLKDRMDYIKNELKTNEGELVRSYDCEVETAVEEFMDQRDQYHIFSGRTSPNEIISYLVIQSFKPGEITSEKANEIGYQLALRFTKGKHSFIVATHNDRAHIHNHIIFNSVTMDCTRKFKDQFYSWVGLKRLNDILCLENQLSVIGEHSHSNNKKSINRASKHRIREDISQVIDEILLTHPSTLDDFFQSLKDKGYTIKEGKHIAIKGPDQQRFIRFRSLKDGYQLSDIENKINNPEVDQLSFLKSIEQQILYAKNDRWKKRFELKDAAKSLLFLQEQKVISYEDLEKRCDACSDRITELQDSIKVKEARLLEITDLRNHIFNYSKTRDVYKQYVKSKFNKKFYLANQEAIDQHKAAKAVFDQLGKVPKVKELNVEFQNVLTSKNKALKELKIQRKEFREWIKYKNIILELKNEERKILKVLKNFNVSSHG